MKWAMVVLTVSVLVASASAQPLGPTIQVTIPGFAARGGEFDTHTLSWLEADGYGYYSYVGDDYELGMYSGVDDVLVADSPDVYVYGEILAEGAIYLTVNGWPDEISLVPETLNGSFDPYEEQAYVTVSDAPTVYATFFYGVVGGALSAMAIFEPSALTVGILVVVIFALYRTIKRSIERRRA